MLGVRDVVSVCVALEITRIRSGCADSFVFSAGECGMIVGPHSTKLPQSWDTESDQLGVPAVLPEQLPRRPCF